MSTERETTRIVRSWLLVDEHESADRVLDMVLDQLDTTPQRRAGWPARRTITMNKFMTIGLGAAAVLVAVLVGIQLFGSSSGVGGPDAEQSPTPEATASPDASAAAIPLPDGGSLAAGRYSISDPYPFTISFEAPEGWLACNFDPYEQGVCENREVGGAGVAFLVVENVVADPCSDAGLDPAVGPSVDDLVTAISNLSGFEASTPTDASVDGYPAKRFTVTAPMTSACQLRTWITPTRTNGVGLGEENLVLVVDVDGERMMVSAAYSPALATDAQMQAVEDVIASITIDP